jgi:hypothetical protein
MRVNMNNDKAPNRKQLFSISSGKYTTLKLAMNYLYTVISGYSKYKISDLAILYRGNLFLPQRIQDTTITFSSTFTGQGVDAFYIYTMCIGAGDLAYYQASYRENGAFHYIDQTTDSQKVIYVYGTP